jgi:catechol-2,3-dioxygenase
MVDIHEYLSRAEQYYRELLVLEVAQEMTKARVIDGNDLDELDLLSIEELENKLTKLMQ